MLGRIWTEFFPSDASIITTLGEKIESLKKRNRELISTIQEFRRFYEISPTSNGITKAEKAEEQLAEMSNLRNKESARHFNEISKKDAKIERLDKKFAEEREAHEATMAGSLEINASWNEEKEKREKLEARVAMLVEALGEASGHCRCSLEERDSGHLVGCFVIEAEGALEATASDVERWLGERDKKVVTGAMKEIMEVIKASKNEWYSSVYCMTEALERAVGISYSRQSTEKGA